MDEVAGSPLALIEHGGGVTEVRLNRPHLLDRFDGDAQVALARTLRRLSADPRARCLVLSSGGTVFSAGGDFDVMLAANEDAAVRQRLVDEATDLMEALWEIDVPIVVALHGDAIGLAATIVLACDAIVAARTARLADTHVRVGLVAGDGGCVVWPAAAGSLRARRHLLTGDPLDAPTAHILGMVTDLVDRSEDVLPAALALAAAVARSAPSAVRGTKRALNHAAREQGREVLALSLAAEAETLASADLREGVAAFRERRRPRFTGR